MAEKDLSKKGKEEADKEDVIEDQNDTETDKEDVIEDQNDTIKGDDDTIMKQIGELRDGMAELRGSIISMKDIVSQFVEIGGVIHEDDNLIEKDNDKSDKFVPIEELDLTL